MSARTHLIDVVRPLNMCILRNLSVPQELSCERRDVPYQSEPQSMKKSRQPKPWIAVPKDRENKTSLQGFLLAVLATTTPLAHLPRGAKYQRSKNSRCSPLRSRRATYVTRTNRSTLFIKLE